MAFLRDALPTSAFLRTATPTPTPPVEGPLFGEFGKGLALGTSGVEGGIQGGVATLQDALGYHDEAMARYEAARLAAAQVAQENQLAVPEFTGINGAGEVLPWAAGALGQGLPTMATGLAGGLAARAGLGGVARLATKRGNVGLATALDNPMLNTVAGSAAGMFPQELGESAMNLYSDPAAMANTTPMGRLGINTLKGGVNAALESIVPAMTINKFVNPGVIGKGVGGVATHVAKGVGTGAAGEFLTEGAQNIVGDVTHGLANPAHHVDPLAAFNAGMAGAVSGGAMMGAGHAGAALKQKVLGRNEDGTDK